MDRIDNDGDGLISTAELKAWIKRVQKRYVYENVAKVWTDYDLNKDNKISWDEYKQATYGYYLCTLLLLLLLLLFFLACLYECLNTAKRVSKAAISGL